jgi:hypothetical protein
MSTTEKKPHHLSDIDDSKSIPRKTYKPPCLIEWGSLVELTQEKFSGFDDYPARGGTTGV